MDVLTAAIYAAIVSEMIFINLSLVDIYSKRKYSRAATYLWLLLITVVLITAALLFFMKSSISGNGNGLFILVGTVYLIPLRFLYRPPFGKLLITLYTSWVYTALAFTVGVQLARLITPSDIALTVLVFQTVFYTASLFVFNKKLRKKYSETLKSMTKNVSVKYLYSAFLMYLSLVAVNYTFVNETKLIALISFVLLGVTFSLCFYFVFCVISAEKSNVLMSRLTFYDGLTGIPNRNSLLAFYEKFMGERKPFSLVFADLDQFKRVNDIYGHNTGDEYLCRFSKYMTEYTAGKANVFRMHGDEFIFLSSMPAAEMLGFLRAGRKKLEDEFNDPAFFGFSAGATDITDDWTLTLDEVLARADSELYAEKREKKHYR